ncbi:MAG: hydrogenase maturation nickel metallochaperone HypA [Candidatus Thorarchaeota archaeon]|nr:hydrogenase maturation nickel metallochaperone HypA [Candidatus Thorarchaeota archaeon]
MHEFSAACSIRDTALEAAKGHDVNRILAVNVEVGEFTFLVPQQLKFNFEIASEGTILEGAELNIEKVNGSIRCAKCGFEGEAQSPDDVPPEIAAFAPMKCPQCNSSNTTITGGRGFVITNIEAELDSDES